MSIRKTLATTTQTSAMPACRSAAAPRRKPTASRATPKEQPDDGVGVELQAGSAEAGALEARIEEVAHLQRDIDESQDRGGGLDGQRHVPVGLDVDPASRQRRHCRRHGVGQQQAVGDRQAADIGLLEDRIGDQDLDHEDRRQRQRAARPPGPQGHRIAAGARQPKGGKGEGAPHQHIERPLHEARVGRQHGAGLEDAAHLEGRQHEGEQRHGSLGRAHQPFVARRPQEAQADQEGRDRSP